MRKQNAKTAVPLDAVPKRRIERCFTRFRSDDRFWSQVSYSCHQTVREKNVGPYKPHATMRQIHFFPTPRFINSNNLYLNNVVLFPPFGTLKCVLVRCNLTIIIGSWTLQYLWLITAFCENIKTASRTSLKRKIVEKIFRHFTAGAYCS